VRIGSSESRLRSRTVIARDGRLSCVLHPHVYLLSRRPPSDFLRRSIVRAIRDAVASRHAITLTQIHARPSSRHARTLARIFAGGSRAAGARPLCILLVSEPQLPPTLLRVAMQRQVAIVAPATAAMLAALGGAAIYVSLRSSAELAQSLRKFTRRLAPIHHADQIEAGLARVRAPAADRAMPLEAIASGKDAPFYYLRVAKTASTAAVSILENQYAAEDICPRQFRHELAELRNPEQYRLYQGHFGTSPLVVAARPVRVGTFLRDPRDWIVSRYYWNRLMGEFPTRLGFADWLNLAMPGPICHEIAAGPYPDPGLGDVERNFRIARSIVDRAEFVGIVEDIGGSYNLMADRIGCFLPDTVDERINPTFGRVAWDDLPAPVRERALRLLEPDIELYRLARAKFARAKNALQERIRETLGLAATPSDAGIRQHLRRARLLELGGATPAASLHYHVAQPLVGEGWLQREFMGGNRADCWRWIQHGLPAHAYFRVASDRPVELRVGIRHLVSLAALNALKVLANGVEIAMAREDESTSGPLAIRGRIPESVLRSTPILALSFVAGAFQRPAEFAVGSTDYRRLSVAVGWIELDAIGAGREAGARIGAAGIENVRDGGGDAAAPAGPAGISEPAYAPGEEIDFSDRAGSRKFLGAGWHETESWGVWSDGPRSELRFRLAAPPGAPLTLRALAHGFVRAAHPLLTVGVWMGARRLAEWRFDYGDATTRDTRWWEAPIPAFDQPTLAITLTVEVPNSPAAVGESDDRRLLGVALRRLVIVAAVPPPPAS
jgi:hypothetical protein